MLLKRSMLLLMLEFCRNFQGKSSPHNCQGIKTIYTTPKKSILCFSNMLQKILLQRNHYFLQYMLLDFCSNFQSISLIDYCKATEIVSEILPILSGSSLHVARLL